MNVDEAAFEITDALGPDFIYLQPPDEHRFDPAAVATGIGFVMLATVCAGILAGIKEAAKEGTKSVIGAVVSAVKRWARTRRPFESADSGEDMVRRLRDEASGQLEAAREALRQLPARPPDGLDGLVATAVREVLLEQGLPERSGQRVERVIQVQIRILVEQTSRR